MHGKRILKFLDNDNEMPSYDIPPSQNHTAYNKDSKAVTIKFGLVGRNGPLTITCGHMFSDNG